MKMYTIKFMLILSMVTIMTKNPMSMGLLLLTQTMLTIFMLNKILMSSWFPMITFLMMIGGLMIIISYMTSISSNEKFKYNLNLTITMIIILIYLDEMFENQIDENQEMILTKSMDQTSMIMLYNYKTFTLSIMLINYLLLTMIVISKIIKYKQGPLRSKI
nr:NADH dehydrogenase subunit 6 [Subulatus sp.]